MNKKQWFVFAIIFLISTVMLWNVSQMWDKMHTTIYDIEMDREKPSDDYMTISYHAWVTNDIIYSALALITFSLSLGCFICGFLEDKKKK